jgi:phosphate-selective porin OprO/OprP
MAAANLQRCLRAPSQAGFLLAVLLLSAAAPAMAAEEQASSASPSSRGSNNDNKAGVTFDSDGVSYQSENRAIQWNLGGRLHFDVGGGEGRGSDLDESSLWRGRLRRAWVEFEAAFNRSWTFEGQIAPFDRDEPIENLAIGYSGSAPLVVVLGNVKEPFSLEELTSSNDITFMERSLANALVPGHNTGLAIGMSGERWTAVAGVFGGNLNDRVDDEGLAVTGRVTFAPIRKDDEVLHLGISGSHRAFDRNQEVEFSTVPESRPYETPLVDLDAIEDARNLSRLGLEFAYLRGSFRIQGEYILAHVDRAENADTSLHGGYLQASYVITGQKQEYEVSPGGLHKGVEHAVFSGIDVDDEDRVSRGGAGAWELAARWSILDARGQDLDGGRLQTVGLGLNWYPEKNMRVMANYIHAFADQRDEGTPRADADIFQMRFQVAY